MRVLVTGGAGFIGSATCGGLLASSHEVGILDNFSRPGSRENLAWIRETGEPEVFEGSVVDDAFVSDCVDDFRPEAIIHLAAQVAVTTSVENPRHDFETNALGTLNLLEATRQASPTAKFIFSSTNKVYGDLEHLLPTENGRRYELPDGLHGIDERAPLDFRSPYGCSKGAAEAYVIEYARIYGLDTTVFRQSCIYGDRQFGIEDQGWIAWLMIAAMTGRPIKVFGDGKQVRDALHVDDLVRLYKLSLDHKMSKYPQIYNVGGGRANSLSILELLEELSSRLGRPVRFEHFDGRQGDQKIFISNNAKAGSEFNWEPEISLEKGLQQLYHWVSANLETIEETVATGAESK